MLLLIVLNVVLASFEDDLQAHRSIKITTARSLRRAKPTDAAFIGNNCRTQRLIWVSRNDFYGALDEDERQT